MKVAIYLLLASVCAASTLHEPRIVLGTFEKHMKIKPALVEPVKKTKSFVNENYCYGANVTSWSWCAGYEDAGYDCAVGSDGLTYCGAEECISSCDLCAIEYDNAVLDKATGTCCDSLDSDGNCVNPKSGNAPPNYIYGFADHHPSLFIYGVVPYENGPSAWNPDENPTGAYAWSAIPGSGMVEDDTCTPIPPEIGIVSDESTHPISFVQHSVPIAGMCQIGCDVSQVMSTGIDPCNKGAINSPVNSANYCFYGGEGWLDGNWGLCGYPCYAMYLDGKPCDLSRTNEECMFYCDPRTAPNTDFPGWK